MATFIPLIFMGALLYLFTRPQRKRLAEQRALLASVVVGDRVMTTSGLYGVVVAEHGDVLVLGVAPGVDLHVVRGAVARKLLDDVTFPAADDLVGVEADQAGGADADVAPGGAPGELMAGGTDADGAADATATPDAAPQPGTERNGEAA